jgi:hypothetical protein
LKRKKKKNQLIGSHGHTLKVGSGDGASIRGLLAGAGDSETLFLVAGEQESWAGPELLDCKRN